MTVYLERDGAIVVADRVPEGYECKRCGSAAPPCTSCSHCGGYGIVTGWMEPIECPQCGASGAQWPPTCPNCTSFRKTPPDPRQHWVTTRIQDRSVEILGDVYVPRDDRPLPHGAEDVDAIFSVYWTGPERQREFVALWGESGPNGIDDSPWPGIFCEGGVFYWEWWTRAQ